MRTGNQIQPCACVRVCVFLCIFRLLAGARNKKEKCGSPLPVFDIYGLSDCFSNLIIAEMLLSACTKIKTCFK